MPLSTLVAPDKSFRNPSINKNRTLDATLLTSLKKCLIINPGYVAKELINEKVFREQYDIFVWNETDSLDLTSYLLFNEFDILLLDPSSDSSLDDDQLRHINNLRVKQVPVYNISSFYENLIKRVPVVHLNESILINSDIYFINRRKRYMLFKRTLDILFSLLISPIALILIVLAIIGIKLTSKGPAFFIQRRVGLKGEVFKIYKLRTMSYTKESNNKAFTTKNDSRITPIGKILRLTKIDELPQLHNILNGDMSLIGPRPEREEIVVELTKADPYYNLRHSIRPGVTGWAQVNNPTATPEQSLEKLEYDLYYVKNASAILDIKIFYRTIKVVFTLNSL